MIKILMADDHAIIREGMRQILAENPDIQIFAEAENGDEAYSLMRKGGWTLMMLDISMPGKDVLDIIKQAKKQFPQLPILIMSAYAEDQYGIRMLQAGADGYLNKAAAPQLLITAIRKLAKGEKFIGPILAEQLLNALNSDHKKPLHASLTDREYQVFTAIAKGLTLTEIAESLSLSIKTISTYRTRLLKKMAMTKNIDIIQYASKIKLKL